MQVRRGAAARRGGGPRLQGLLRLHLLARRQDPARGTPVDEFKILGVRDGAGGAREVDIKFTAVSPNSRLIDRRAVATATAVGDTAYIFVVSAAAVKWKEERDTVETVARTFKASF